MAMTALLETVLLLNRKRVTKIVARAYKKTITFTVSR